jgi:ABC-type branched-subunit amino acid transport system permease subunit
LGHAFGLLVLLIGGIGAAIVGLLVGVPPVKGYLAITTLGFSEIIRVVIQNLDIIGASQGFRGIYVYANGVKSLEMVQLSNVHIKFTQFQNTQISSGHSSWFQF